MLRCGYQALECRLQQLYAAGGTGEGGIYLVIFLLLQFTGHELKLCGPVSAQQPRSISSHPALNTGMSCCICSHNGCFFYLYLFNRVHILHCIWALVLWQSVAIASVQILSLARLIMYRVLCLALKAVFAPASMQCKTLSISMVFSLFLPGKVLEVLDAIISEGKLLKVVCYRSSCRSGMVQLLPHTSMLQTGVVKFVNLFTDCKHFLTFTC